MYRFQYFAPGELRCKCGNCSMGEQEMDARFMHRVIDMRRIAGFWFIVNSAARCSAYNDSIYVARGYAPGTHLVGPHTLGRAIDFRVYGYRAARLEELARIHGMTGLGFKQHGPHGKRFMHVDDLTDAPGQPRPWLWTY